MGNWGIRYISVLKTAVRIPGFFMLVSGSILKAPQLHPKATPVSSKGNSFCVRNKRSHWPFGLQSFGTSSSLCLESSFFCDLVDHVYLIQTSAYMSPPQRSPSWPFCLKSTYIPLFTFSSLLLLYLSSQLIISTCHCVYLSPISFTAMYVWGTWNYSLCTPGA